jgi:hypothetical protein
VAVDLAGHGEDSIACPAAGGRMQGRDHEGREADEEYREPVLPLWSDCCIHIGFGFVACNSTSAIDSS